MAGSATLAVYSAVKAFQHNFAEGLWAELRPQPGSTCAHAARHDLPRRFNAWSFEYDPQSQMLSEEVAREIIENIGNGPVHVVGENNRRWHRRSGRSTGGPSSR